MPSTLFDTFIEALRDAMRSHDVSQTELARRTGVHPVAINRLLNKQLHNTTFALAEKLLDAAKADKTRVRQTIG